MTLASVIRMHLSRLTDFSGREPGRVFWPWVALLFGVATTVNTVGMVTLVVPTMLGDDPGRELFGAIEAYLTAFGSSILFGVVMVASSVARRLHDAGRSGAYGLLPLPFLTLGFLLFRGMFSGALTREGVRGSFATLFALGFVNNLVYLGTVAFLVFLLVKPSEAAENRFGPRSEPA